MAFDTGIYGIKPDAGKIRGRQIDVAVLCWYTASGKAMPRLLKIENENGEYQEIRDIRVLEAEQKWYAGIPVWEYQCQVSLYGRERKLKLLFQPEECCWKLVVP